jgi:hypothetical protein
MDNVTTHVLEAVRQTVSSYATRGYSGGQPSQLFYVENMQDQVFCVVAPFSQKYQRADLVVMARIISDQVVIEADKTSEPLYDALRKAGIPETQIAIAWSQKSQPASTR